MCQFILICFVSCFIVNCWALFKLFIQTILVLLEVNISFVNHSELGLSLFIYFFNREIFIN